MTLIKLRKTVSLLIFFLSLALFTGGDKISSFLSQILPPFQFVPALMRTLNDPAPLFVAGLISIVGMTLIFGRIYCSFLCPLGVFQDLILAASRRLGKKSALIVTPPSNALRYILLIVAGAAVIFGFQSVIGVLDPFALWGRMLTDFFQPLLIGFYNLGIWVLTVFDIYLYPKQSAAIAPPALAVSAVLGGLITFLAASRGRLYCNTVCPVGTFLGLLSRVSRFRFFTESHTCTKCGLCVGECKAGCIDPITAAVDMTRCVVCFDCLDVCVPASIRYRLSPSPAVRPETRRRFVIGATAGVGALALASHTGLRSLVSGRISFAEPPVTPPGSAGLARFNSRCIACSLCVAACPTSVLVPSFSNYDASAFLQPKLNFEKSYCDYECHVCGQVCPTGAIGALPLDEKKRTAIGEARLLEEICVVYIQHNNCGACGEVCPTHAVRFVDRNNILYPEIDKQYCIGCGACQLACPTSPRSIVVQPHPVHKTAEKYVGPETEIMPSEKSAPDRDFPF